MQMKVKEIKETPIWSLYEKGRNYHRLTGIYSDTDRNHRMYNGNQWEGAKLGGVEPLQLNVLKPIVKYKVAVIHNNLYEIVYSSQNYENPTFQREAERYCKLLNGYARRLWEKDQMDYKGRKVTKDAAINDEGIIYIDFDKEKMTPVHEIVDKNDIYYGNENDDDIQNQPYILIRKRMPVSSAIELALKKGMDKSKESFIVGDNDNFEESGEAAKFEVDSKATIVYKMYKKDGSVHFSAATRWVNIIEDIDLGISLYPVAHFVWEEKKGSARGEGEVRHQIPNQIEINRTIMRRVLTVKNQAYPQKVVDINKIANPQALNSVGSTIRVTGTVDDVHKIVGAIPPAHMSPDVKNLQDDLIHITRELAGAGETATGQVNPETASGRAFLVIQQASQEPITEQKEGYKTFIENIAKINLEYLVAYAKDGINMEERLPDPKTGTEVVRMVNIPQSALQQLKATVKIDITPKGVYDRLAMEQTMENFLMQGFFTAQRVGELEAYLQALPDDATTPKRALLACVENIKKNQQKIAQIQSAVQRYQQRAQQFIMDGPEGQASRLADVKMQLMARQQGNLGASVVAKEQEIDKVEKG